MRALVIAILLCVSHSAWSKQFSATCEPDETHAYRNSMDIGGQPLGAEWTDDEEFFSKWNFDFNGRNRLLLEGERIEIIYWDGTSLLAIENSSNESAASSWLYAFNLDLNDLVGSQVNSYSTLGTGIKARSSNFICDFSFR